MNKLFSKIAAASVGLAMAIGVGVAVGQSAKEVKAAEYLAHTFSGATATGSSDDTNYATAHENTQEGITWMAYGNLNMSPWRVGGKSTDKDTTVTHERALYSTTALSQNISKIEVASGSATITVNSLTISVHSSAEDAESGNNAVATKTESSSANIVSKTVTFERTSGNWENCFYRIVYNVSVKGTSNKYVQFSFAKFYYEVSVVNPDAISVSGETEVSVGSSTNYSAICTKSSSAEGVNQNVVWSSSNEKVAVVSETGVVTGISNGTATIRATAAEVAVYGEKTITVVNGKTDDSAYVLLPDDASFGGYGDYNVGVKGVFMHFKQSAKMSEKGNYYIQLQATNGIIENVGALPADITKIELSINPDSNGSGYVVSVSADGETYNPVSADAESNVTYTVSAGNRYFKLTAGSGTLRLDEILIGFGNANEAKMVTLANTLNGMLDAECEGEGDTNPITSEKWAEIAQAYADGDADAKAALAAVGNNGSYQEVNKFLSRYDHIVAAYGYTNFLAREVPNPAYNMPIENSGSAIIIIIAATFAVTTFGAILLIRKKKHSK